MVRRRKKTAKPEEQSAKTTIARLFEMPESSLPGTLHIEMSANHEAIVEGCKGVLEYGDGVIRLSAGELVVTFRGKELSMGGMDHSNAVVTGCILSVEFSN